MPALPPTAPRAPRPRLRGLRLVLAALLGGPWGAAALAQGAERGAEPPTPGAILREAGGALTAEGEGASEEARAAHGPVVDEVVAVVGDAIITRSELELESRVVLVNAGGVEAAFGPVDADTVGSVLDYLVNQTLIVAEAERLEVFEVPPSEVTREVQRFLGRFPEAAARVRFLEAQDVSEERLGAIFRRDLRVERYLDSRVGAGARPGPGEVEAFYRRHRERFGDRGLDEVRESVRGYLVRQRYQEAVGRLVDRLRDRADVRLLVPVPAFPARPGASPGDGSDVASERGAVLSDRPR